MNIIKKILLSLIFVSGGTAAFADDIAYVYNVTYSNNTVYVYVKMNTDAQTKYKSVRVKVSPEGTALRLFGDGVYKYTTITGDGTPFVSFTCNGDGEKICGISDYDVKTVDKEPKNKQ